MRDARNFFQTYPAADALRPGRRGLNEPIPGPTTSSPPLSSVAMRLKPAGTGGPVALRMPAVSAARATSRRAAGSNGRDRFEEFQTGCGIALRLRNREIGTAERPDSSSGCCSWRVRLVWCLRNSYTIAARDFSARRGASDAHIPKWICKERATKSGRKRSAPLWVAPNLACGCVARRSQIHRGICSPPRALPQAKLGATIV